MCGEVGHTTNSVTLDLNIGVQHLAYERLEATKLDDE